MAEEERWKSFRRCHECLMNGKTNYLWAQKWGKTDEDKQLYKLDCLECGFHTTGKWDGK